jgi:hypothetical protein
VRYHRRVTALLLTLVALLGKPLYKVEIDNAWVHVVREVIPPHETIEAHVHPTSVIVWLTNSRQHKAGDVSYSLAGAHVEKALFVLHAKHAAQHNRDFLERRPLSRLQPTLWRHHPRDAHRLVARIHAPGIFLDAFGLVSRCFNANGLVNEGGHPVILHALQKHLLQGSQAVYTDSSLGI